MIFFINMLSFHYSCEKMNKKFQIISKIADLFYFFYKHTKSHLNFRGAIKLKINLELKWNASFQLVKP